jgi:hypothetical protein
MSVPIFRLRDATPLIAWYMRCCGFDGWASLWRTAYFLPGGMDDHGLVRHELKHLEQIERDGRVLFMVKYVWWLCRYGYWNNPYEIEARAAASQQPTSEALMR